VPKKEEVFVTESYLKMIEENKKYQAEDQKLEAYNTKHSI